MEGNSLPQIENKASWNLIPTEIKHLTIRPYVQSLTCNPSEALTRAFRGAQICLQPEFDAPDPIPAGKFYLHTWARIRIEDNSTIAAFKTKIITDSLTVASCETRRVFIHELKEALKNVQTNYDVVREKLLRLEVAYFVAMAEDSKRECHGNIFVLPEWAPCSMAMLQKYGVFWMEKNRDKFNKRAKLYGDRAALTMQISVLRDIIQVLERGTPV